MKLLTGYAGTVDGFRKWLTGQRPSQVVSLYRYRKLKEKRMRRGKRK